MPHKLVAVYPGSFDPPTLGHIDIIERALKVFGELVVLIAESPTKKSLFTAQERKVLLQNCLKKLQNVKVDIHGGLTVDYLKKIKGHVIIRGLRAVSDFENELQMATMNRKLYPEIETFAVMTSEKYHYISSHTVKEVAIHGGDISELVPEPVIKAIKSKMKSQEK